MLKKEGKGNKPNAAEALDDQDISILWETGAFGEKTLQNTVWYLLTMHMVCEVEIKVLYGDFKNVEYPTKSRALPSTPIKEIPQQTTTSNEHT